MNELPEFGRNTRRGTVFRNCGRRKTVTDTQTAAGGQAGGHKVSPPQAGASMERAADNFIGTTLRQGQRLPINNPRQKKTFNWDDMANEKKKKVHDFDSKLQRAGGGTLHHPRNRRQTGGNGLDPGDHADGKARRHRRARGQVRGGEGVMPQGYKAKKNMKGVVSGERTAMKSESATAPGRMIQIEDPPPKLSGRRFK